MMHAPGLFDLPDHLARLSATDDPLEALERHVDFEAFRTVLMEAPGYGVRAKGRRPPYDPVTMFKVLVLASMHNPGDERMEFLIRDRLSWLRFPGFEIGEPTPDQKTIWLFREKLTRSGAERGVSDINRHTSPGISWSRSQVFTLKKSDLSFHYENFIDHASVAAPVTALIPWLERRF